MDEESLIDVASGKKSSDEEDKEVYICGPIRFDGSDQFSIMSQKANSYTFTQKIMLLPDS